MVDFTFQQWAIVNVIPAIIYTIEMAGLLYTQRTSDMGAQVLSQILSVNSPSNMYWIGPEKPDNFWWTWNDEHVLGRRRTDKRGCYFYSFYTARSQYNRNYMYGIFVNRKKNDKKKTSVFKEGVRKTKSDTSEYRMSGQ